VVIVENGATSSLAVRNHTGQKAMDIDESGHPNPGLAYLLWCLVFVGFAGIHRFYSGRWVTGLIWVLTGGLLLIGQLVDLFLIPGQCRRPKW